METEGKIGKTKMLVCSICKGTEKVKFRLVFRFKKSSMCDDCYIYYRSIGGNHRIISDAEIGQIEKEEREELERRGELYRKEE